MLMHGDARLDGLESGEAELGYVEVPSVHPFTSHSCLIFDKHLVRD
jgi:hypothetical protein